MIVRGTTPTIKVVFDQINVSTITAAYLTIKQNGRNIIEKDITDAETGQKYLQWTLTQQETISLDIKFVVEMQCRYKTTDGNAYATEVLTTNATDVLKDGVI